MSSRHADKDDQGIGLYTKEQEQNTTPFDYFAQIVVGAVVFFTGVLVLVGIFGDRSKEILRFGSPESHRIGFVAAPAIMVIGAFMAHAGVIFWSRRIRSYLKNRHRHQRRA